MNGEALALLVAWIGKVDRHVHLAFGSEPTQTISDEKPDPFVLHGDPHGRYGTVLFRTGGLSPFKDGTLYRLTTVRTEANSQVDYFKQLDQIYFPTMVQAKELGLIKSFRILAGDAGNKEDFDVMLMVEFENMAAMDNTPEREAKWKAIREGMKTKLGGQEKVDAVRAAINTKRDMLGGKLMREKLHK